MKILLFIIFFCFNSIAPIDPTLFYLFRAIDRRNSAEVVNLITEHPDIVNAENLYSIDGEHHFFGTPLAYARSLSPFLEFPEEQKIIEFLEYKNAVERSEKIDMLESRKKKAL